MSFRKRQHPNSGGVECRGNRLALVSLKLLAFKIELDFFPAVKLQYGMFFYVVRQINLAALGNSKFEMPNESQILMTKTQMNVLNIWILKFEIV